MHPIKSIQSYWQALPPIIWVHLVMAGLLTVLGKGLKKAAAWALLSDGRVAVTTGDFQFLFTTWQGWVLMLLAIAAVYLYLAFDLCSTILAANDIIKGKRVSVITCLKKAPRFIKSFLCPEGIVIVAYIALVVPVTGIGFTTSLTDGLKIPTFISAAIDQSPFLTGAYRVLFAVL
ncbi:MAG: glycerophosphoryl diester phosphodiesterase membrane domain-containing protein, partial [Atopobiaceae bacterium]|nr:glycerophosphoryl diester phosphodiesterase membrane domain-containing protein [Atopobiaceae bacterium]